MKKIEFLKRVLTLMLSCVLLSLSLASCATKKNDVAEGSSVGGDGTSDSSTDTTPVTEFVPKITDAEKRKLYGEHQDIEIYPEGKVPAMIDGESEIPAIVPYLASGEDSSKCIVIFPGGGYFMRGDDNEGAEVASVFNELGISVFVVKYRIKPYDKSAILTDALRAVRYIRYNAESFGVNPERIAVCGFSAGGHLAMTVCQHEDEAGVIGDEIDLTSAAPNACILSYPVVTLGDGTYYTMPGIFLGEENAENEELIKQYSYKYAIDKMPPTFVWTSKLDSLIDYHKNAEAIAALMKGRGMTVEYKAYDDGEHGIGTGAAYAQCSKWEAHAVMFLNKIGF